MKTEKEKYYNKKIQIDELLGTDVTDYVESLEKENEKLNIIIENRKEIDSLYTGGSLFFRGRTV